MTRKIFFSLLILLLIVPSSIKASNKDAQSENWGIISLTGVYLRRTPSHAAEIITQATMGTPVKILHKAKNGWFYIETPDQYKSYVHPESVVLKNKTEFNLWKSAKRYIYTKQKGYIYDKPKKNGEPISDIVLGCIVEAQNENCKNYYSVKLPNQRIGYVKKDEVQSIHTWAQKKPNINEMIQNGVQMMGTTYFWGGMTTYGCDCSGLSKIIYYSGGVILKRDAHMQAATGENIETNNISNYQKGDLLFFGEDKEHITHVAIYINNGKFIHSSGRVRYNSLNKTDKDYYTLIPVSACRILSSLDTEGIVRVINHPWYF